MKQFLLLDGCILIHSILLKNAAFSDVMTPVPNTHMHTPDLQKGKQYLALCAFISETNLNQDLYKDWESYKMGRQYRMILFQHPVLLVCKIRVFKYEVNQNWILKSN